MAGISKIVYGNETLIDLTSDTVDANSMLSGKTAHQADGDVVTGNIPTKSESDIEIFYDQTPDDAFVCFPSGYYASNVSYKIDEAAINFTASKSISGTTATVTSKLDVTKDGTVTEDRSKSITTSVSIDELTDVWESGDIDYEICEGYIHVQGHAGYYQDDPSIEINTVTVYSGTNEPATQIGTDGDIYIKI